jgi:hypothetical protein
MTRSPYQVGSLVWSGVRVQPTDGLDWVKRYRANDHDLAALVERSQPEDGLQVDPARRA